MNRRALLVRAACLAATATVAGRLPGTAQIPAPAFAYPMALPGRPPGDGFFLRHGYAVENTWFAPGNLHTGEDWYAVEGETAGAEVVAVAAGEVVYADADYPGRVVIVRHAPDLFSMYGHLDDALSVAAGQTVERGDVLGTVLARADEFPNHLHFEIRTFLTTAEVNGDAPRYGFACGPGCAPGPGYWPIDAPEHPSAIGWRNPTHVIASRAEAPESAEVVVAATAGDAADLWSAPEGDGGAERLERLPLAAGDRFALLATDAGPEATTGTSAEAYRLWYRIELPDGGSAWVRAAVASGGDTGSDGRPSSVTFDFLPAVAATRSRGPATGERA